MSQTLFFSAWKRGVVSVILTTFVSAANAQQLGTAAWTQTFAQVDSVTHLASLAQDANGNCYSLYRIGKSTPGANIYLRAFDKSGALIFAKPVVSTSIDAKEGAVYVSKPIGNVQFIYVSATYRDSASHWNVYYAKFSTAGNLIWSRSVTGGGGAAFPVGLDTDASGNAYIASGSTFPVRHLDLLKVDANGSTLSHGTNSRFGPNDLFTTPAYHVDGKWIVNGIDNYHVSSSMWGLFDEGTASLKLYRYFVDHRSTTTDYHYFVYAQPYNGAVLGVTDIQYNKIGYGNLHHQYQIALLTYAGVQTWASKLQTGWAASVIPGTSANPSYVVGQSESTNQPYLQQLSSSGVFNWNIPLPANTQLPLLVIDSTGVTIADSNLTGAIHAQVTRYGTSGMQQWSMGASGGVVASLTSDGSSTFLGTQSVTPGPQGAVIERFVSGFALATLSGTKSVKGGQSANFTASFNSSAPTNGTLRVHSNNTWLQFANNSTTIDMPYTAGATSVTVTAHTQATIADKNITVTASYNGVNRAVRVTVFP